MKSNTGLCAFLALSAMAAGSAPAAEQPAQAPFDLGQICEGAGFWQKDASALEAFEKKSPFRWVSQERAEMRAAEVPMSYLGLPVVEAVIRVEGGNPRGVFLSI